MLLGVQAALKPVVLPLLLSMLLFQPFTRYPVSGKLAVERVLGARAKVEVRNGPGEQQAAGIVPVVLGLDDFRARRSYEFSDVDLQALADRRQIFQIAFLQVLIEV